MNLTGKTIFVTGVGTTGMGEATAKQVIQLGGQVVLSCHPDIIKRAKGQAEELGGALVIPCDLGDDDSVAQLASDLRAKGVLLDGALHSVAFASREALGKDTINDLTTAEMMEAINVSGVSLQRLIRHLLGNGVVESVFAQTASIVTITFGLATERVVFPYHVMALAKAVLEELVIYEAATLGPSIRVNAVNAGATRTTAGKGITDFTQMLKASAAVAPLKCNVTPKDVANAVCFLLSPASSVITGHFLTVDAGLRILADTSAPASATPAE